MSFVDNFIFIGILQGVFVGVSLLTARFFKSRPNVYLGLAILTLTIITFFGWKDFDQIALDILQNVMWELLFPVFLFCYFIHSLNHRFKDQAWTKWLYAPFVISAIVQLILDLDFRFSLYELTYEEDDVFLEIYYNVIYNLGFFYGLGLVIWSGKLLWKEESPADRRIKWLRGVFISVLCLYGIWLLAEIAEDTFDEDVWLLLWAGLAILFLSAMYFGIFQLRLLDERKEITAMLNKKGIGNGSKDNGKINNDQRTIQLKKLMEEERLFRDSDLTRGVVAEKMQMSNGYFSQFMKEVQGKSFVDFVNTYRVEAAKEMLSDSEFNKFSLHAIGLEAGFKSRSSFYSTFQKFTGRSPGEFKKDKLS